MRVLKGVAAKSRQAGKRTIVGAIVASTLVTGCIIEVSGPAVASEASDRAQIAQLEQRLERDGARIQSLVARQNQVQGRLDTLRIQIARDERQLDTDKRAADASLKIVRQIAVRAYVTGSGLDLPELGMLGGASDITSVLQQTKYLGAVNSKLDGALLALQAEQSRINDDRDTLRNEQDQAKASLTDVNQARHDAEAAIASEQSLLAHTKGNLAALIAARQQAEARAAEQRLAAAQVAANAAQAQPTTSVPTPSTPPPVSQPPPPPPPPLPPPGPPPAGYANPLRSVGGLTPERIDQGVDYAGIGPIYAVGNGVVLTTTVPGWPDGTYIAYQLTDGPAAGLVVYAAEDIQPYVQTGQHVNADTALGEVYAGPYGIETGWGDPTALGNTMARTYNQYGGGNSTAFGANFSRFLQSLGAPGGVLQNNPPTGSLPAGWPNW